MRLPYAGPLEVLEPAPRVIPEPPRRGDPGGPPCGICSSAATSAVWEDEYFTLHPPVHSSLPGAVWVASKAHADSFSDLAPAVAAAFGPMVARVETAMLAVLDDVARVHLYRWGDGGAHFHVWLLPRPLGMLDAQGMYLPVWEDVLPEVPDEESLAAARNIAVAIDG